MDHNHMSLDLRGKKIVSVTNGEIIGEVVDILVDPNQRHVAALVTSRGNLFRRETQLLHRDDISVIGKHVILSNRPDVIRNQEDYGTTENWVAVSEHLRGNDVVTSDGTRIGRIHDIIVDGHGQIVGYALASVVVSGALQESKQIPADSIVSFGKDVVIVDPSVITRQGEPLLTESDRVDIFGREREEPLASGTDVMDRDPLTADDRGTPLSDRDLERFTDRDEPLYMEDQPGSTRETHVGVYGDTNRDAEVEDFGGTRRDPRMEDQLITDEELTAEDYQATGREYPRSINEDFADRPLDEETYPETRDYQKPRFHTDDEERRGDF